MQKVKVKKAKPKFADAIEQLHQIGFNPVMLGSIN